MGQATGCCTTREDEATEAQRSARPSARTSAAYARKGQAEGSEAPAANGDAANGNSKGDESAHDGYKFHTEAEDESYAEVMMHRRSCRSSFSEGSGLEVSVHRLALLTLKKDITARQVEHPQAVLKACVEYVPGLARWTFQPVLPDTEGLANGYTHAMYTAFEDQKSLENFDENPKHHEVEELLMPLLENEDGMLVLSWERNLHLKDSGVDRLMVFKASDKAQLVQVLMREKECVQDIAGYKLYHHGPHHEEQDSLNKEFNYGFYASFADEEALATYKANPIHKELQQELAKCLDGPVGPKTIVCVNYSLA